MGSSDFDSVDEDLWKIKTVKKEFGLRSGSELPVIGGIQVTAGCDGSSHEGDSKGAVGLVSHAGKKSLVEPHQGTDVSGWGLRARCHCASSGGENREQTALQAHADPSDGTVSGRRGQQAPVLMEA